MHLRDVHKAGLRLPEDEWDDILGFFEQEQLVCRTGSGGWVLCRDLNHYSLDQLLRCNPWPLSARVELPEQLDEPWYPTLRRSLELLQQEQANLFGGSLADWLQAGGDKKRQ